MRERSRVVVMKSLVVKAGRIPCRLAILARTFASDLAQKQRRAPAGRRAWRTDLRPWWEEYDTLTCACLRPGSVQEV